MAYLISVFLLFFIGCDINQLKEQNKTNNKSYMVVGSDIKSLKKTSHDRYEIGKLMRYTFLDQKMDLYVKVSGKYNEIITLTSPLFNETNEFIMETDEMYSKLHQYGFQQINVSNGQYYFRTYKFNK